MARDYERAASETYRISLPIDFARRGIEGHEGNTHDLFEKKINLQKNPDQFLFTKLVVYR